MHNVRFKTLRRAAIPESSALIFSILVYKLFAIAAGVCIVYFGYRCFCSGAYEKASELKARRSGRILLEYAHSAASGLAQAVPNKSRQAPFDLQSIFAGGKRLSLQTRLNIGVRCYVGEFDAV